MLLLLLESDINGTRLKCFEPFRGWKGRFEFFCNEKYRNGDNAKLRCEIGGFELEFALFDHCFVLLLKEFSLVHRIFHSFQSNNFT